MEQPEPDETIAGMRRMVLATEPGDLGLAAADDPERVYGVLMEIGYEAAVVTIVSLIDGTTSMYFSSGGGTVGAGEQESVADATRAFVAMAQVLVGQTESTTDFPLPEVAHVRFQLLTIGGGRSAVAPQAELGGHRHRLSPLFFAGQDVITEIRMLQESRPG